MEFVLAGGNLLRPPTIDDLDVLAAGQALGHAAGIHGDVTATDDHDGLGQFGPFAAVDAPQEGHAVDDARVLIAWHAHGLAPPGADAEQHRLVPLLELFEGYLMSEPGVEVHLDARAVIEDSVHVLLDDPHWKPEGRDAPDHHAAEAVGHLVEVHFVARLGQVLRGGHARRPRTDDAHRLVLRDLDGRQMVILSELIHDEALEIADRQGAVGVGAAAGRLARGIANPAADGTERIGGGDRLEGLFDLVFPDVGDVGRRVRADGAGHLTGRRHEVGVVGVVEEFGRVLDVHPRRRSLNTHWSCDPER